MLNILDVCRQFNIKPNNSCFILCPFHKEKTASMKLYTDKQGKHCIGEFYCFGCGEHGDAIRLYAHLKGISNGEAFREHAAEPTKKQLREMEHMTILKEWAECARVKILEDYTFTKKVMERTKEILDLKMASEIVEGAMIYIPTEIYELIEEHTKNTINLEISESLNDNELWEWYQETYKPHGTFV